MPVPRVTNTDRADRTDTRTAHSALTHRSKPSHPRHRRTVLPTRHRHPPEAPRVHARGASSFGDHMAAITANLDTRPLSEALGRISKATGRTALRRSLNRASKAMETQSIREVRNELTLKARDVRKAIRRPRLTASSSGVAAEIGISLKPVPVSRFQARQVRKGVSVKIKKSGGRSVIPRTFKATMPSGHEGVYRRKTTKRLPIQELFSTSAGSTIRDREILRRIQARGREQFTMALGNQIRQAVRKRGRQ